MELWVQSNFRLHEPYAVDGGQHDAVGRVSGYNLLAHEVVVLNAQCVELRVGYLLHLVVEETIEVAVVLVDVERTVLVLGVEFIEH